MKKLLIKLFGDVWYCRQFHTTFSDKTNNSKWHCDKCDISFKKLLSDNSVGPR